MKKTILVALLSACCLPAYAETSSIDGCEVKQIENSNAYYRVDPNCSFSSFREKDEDSSPEVFGKPEQPIDFDDIPPRELIDPPWDEFANEA